MLEAGIHTTKTVCQSRSRDQMRKVSVSRRCHRDCIDRIISNRQGGGDAWGLEHTHTHTHTPSTTFALQSIKQGGLRWIEGNHRSERIRLNSSHSSWFVTTNSTHGKEGHGCNRRASPPAGSATPKPPDQAFVPGCPSVLSNRRRQWLQDSCSFPTIVFQLLLPFWVWFPFCLRLLFCIVPWIFIQENGIWIAACYCFLPNFSSHPPFRSGPHWGGAYQAFPRRWCALQGQVDRDWWGDGGAWGQAVPGLHDEAEGADLCVCVCLLVCLCVLVRLQGHHWASFSFGKDMLGHDCIVFRVSHGSCPLLCDSSDQIEQMKAWSCSSHNETDTLLVTQDRKFNKIHHISSPASSIISFFCFYFQKNLFNPLSSSPQLVLPPPPLCFFSCHSLPAIFTTRSTMLHLWHICMLR